MGMIYWCFLIREDFELVGKVLMEYGSGICPLQASPVLSSKQTVWPSPKRLRKDVLAKDESES